ncbi:putative membrane protein [Anaerovibrio sp. JC8]|uniref:YdcF family protein n=1 Tax=Anaerovibrio sp. JC8 TaxID=1240085 RepID=UPI000A0E3359|nr:YdcF family protein [Anaerovibrio sp. JC8]ORU01040.1 putative membrane protein [Anaerovibrio sp. JC8]
MIYILKFGASLLMPPGIFIVLFLVMSVWLWRREERKIASILGGITIVFYLLSTTWFSSLLIGTLENDYSMPDKFDGDCIIMLGGGALSGTPSLDGEGTLSGAAGSRMALVAQIYKKTGLPVIVSGGQVYDDSGNEAHIAQRELTLLGVPAKDILIEDQSLNTRQNAIYSAQIMAEHGWHKPVLVTSAFHMSRSVLNFAKEGIDVIPAPADFRASHPQSFNIHKLRPSADALADTTIFLQEKLRSMVTRYLSY